MSRKRDDLEGLPIFGGEGPRRARQPEAEGRPTGSAEPAHDGVPAPRGASSPAAGLSGAVGAVAAGRRPAPPAARPADVQPGDRRLAAGPWTGAIPTTIRPVAPPDARPSGGPGGVPGAAPPGPASQRGPDGGRRGEPSAPAAGDGADAWVAGGRQVRTLEASNPGGLRDSEFWRQVNSLRGEVSSRLTNALAARELDEEEREALGQELIQQVVRDRTDAMLSGGQRPWTAEYQVEITRALFDALFRLGRLQPLIDTPDVENIEITGTQPVLMLMGDGRRVYTEPIADSDGELIDFLQFLAARDPANERSFTRANPFLNLDLPGRVRLAAVGWVVPSPRVTIRLQRLQSVDLDVLRGTGTVDAVLEQFLTAAVRARKSIVVSGQGQGSGKTTLLRALCASLSPWESVATIETDYELYLHLEPEKHRRVVALRTREGSGEMNTAGRRVGEIDTNINVYESLRHNISRVIVGEVRGPEIVSMFQAMQMGNGSLSTVHADGARDVVERLVGMAVQDSTLSETYAYRQVAQSIDLIVFLRVDIDPATGLRTRYVSEVIEVTRGEAGNPVAITDVFRPGPDGRAVPAHTPSFLADLEAVGFDPNLLNFHEGLWGATP
ncbi:CpaF family protein [Myceligenerans pegani]|uniref:Type II/IV secretion system ATPase subunit n=1 Tax=Myceligenerans pegani TaxID=2776917 RepID=A0ABR9N323_9MICO|nr:CpaF/VirB11 family protein [Myceligenerans sp. TRM 65318]MBE1877539.1 type II/IV secretion system ATPase subunit [Myceligenerans sp. TRM 65318]MBE3019810.1 type II/IV secretion system ATPase subunit [Myceligenerans sp. TRM 65318]